MDERTAESVYDLLRTAVSNCYGARALLTVGEDVTGYQPHGGTIVELDDALEILDSVRDYVDGLAGDVTVPDTEPASPLQVEGA